MLHSKIFTVFASLLVVCLTQRGYSSCRRRICVFIPEPINKKSNQTEPYILSVKDIDPNLCTHIKVYVAPIDGNKLKTPYWDDDKGPEGLYDQLRNLKKINKRLKLMLMVGDKDHHSEPFSKMAATVTGRTEFINFLIPFLRDRGFDGVELKWYVPGFLGGVKSDKQRFADLIQEMSTAFDNEPLSHGRKRLILSAYGYKEAFVVDYSYNVTAFARYLDMVDLGTLNYGGYLGYPIGHIAPLESNNRKNIKETVGYWMELGMPKEKINIDLPVYGSRVYTKSSSDMKIGESTAEGMAPVGNYSGFHGVATHFEICRFIKQGGQVHWDSLASAPYHIQDNYFLTYDNEQSFQDKILYVRQTGIGGVIINGLNYDDYRGIECGTKPFPMSTTVKDACSKPMD